MDEYVCINCWNKFTSRIEEPIRRRCSICQSSRVVSSIELVEAMEELISGDYPNSLKLNQNPPEHLYQVLKTSPFWEGFEVLITLREWQFLWTQIQGVTMEEFIDMMLVREKDDTETDTYQGEDDE